MYFGRFSFFVFSSFLPSCLPPFPICVLRHPHVPSVLPPPISLKPQGLSSTQWEIGLSAPPPPVFGTPSQNTWGHHRLLTLLNVAWKPTFLKKHMIADFMCRFYSVALWDCFYEKCITNKIYYYYYYYYICCVYCQRSRSLAAHLQALTLVNTPSYGKEKEIHCIKLNLNPQWKHI